MNAYEFTRFESDFTSKVKAPAYDARIVAMMAARSFEKNCKDYKQDPDYIEARHVFIDTTMSCNQREAVQWLQYYMANAIAYGIQTKNLDWKTKFLAAWDLYRQMPSKLTGIGIREDDV